MQSLGEHNRDWAERILLRVDPSFKHRWVVYDDTVAAALTPATVWIDCGCGDNSIVQDLSPLAKVAVGVDSQDSGEAGPDFVRADIRRLPFRSGCADLITLRFVVEHFPSIGPYFDEIARALRPNGRVIILTTNTRSPVISIPRWLLPFHLKTRILSALFAVESRDVFPTHHKLNSPARFRKGVGRFKLQRLEFLSDLNYVSRPVFMILLAWHLLTRPRRLHQFRMNILAVLTKDGSQNST